MKPIDDLTPVELAELLAEKLMGWTRKNDGRLRVDQFRDSADGPLVCRHDLIGGPYTLWSPAENWQDCGEVLERLGGATVWQHRDGSWRCFLGDFGGVTTAPTPQLAICRAAAKAVQEEK